MFFENDFERAIGPGKSQGSLDGDDSSCTIPLSGLQVGEDGQDIDVLTTALFDRLPSVAQGLRCGFPLGMPAQCESQSAQKMRGSRIDPLEFFERRDEIIELGGKIGWPGRSEQSDETTVEIRIMLEFEGASGMLSWSRS